MSRYQRLILGALATLSLLAAVIVVIAAGLPERADFTGVAVAPGTPAIAPELNAFAPPITGTTFDGQPFDLTDLRGDPVVINFWATWCAPCRAEIPELQTLYATYAADGLHIVGVNLGEDDAAIQSWVDGFGMGFTIVPDRERRVETRYRLRGQPSSYVVAPSGIITHIFFGPVDAATLENAIAPYLDQS